MVKIMTDTASMFTPEVGAELGIPVAPLTVTIAGHTYRENVEMFPPAFLKLIREGHLPTSSQPAPGDLIEHFERATKRDPLIYITMADGLSGTYQSGCAVRETMENREYITVLDSKTLCGPEGAIVRKAHRLAQEGKSVQEIVAELQENIASNKSYLIPQDFSYLRRGGRLSPGAAHVGGLLRLVPLLVQSESGRSLDKAALCRNFTKTVEKVIEGFRRWGVDESYLISISHADTFEQGSLAYSMLSAAFRGTALELNDLTPVFITQGGPKCVSIQAIKRT